MVMVHDAEKDVCNMENRFSSLNGNDNTVRLCVCRVNFISVRFCRV